jgi:hypothetical protein
MPSEKYWFSASALMFTKGSTAIEGVAAAAGTATSLVPTEFEAGVAPALPPVTGAGGSLLGQNRFARISTTSTTSPTTISRSMRRPVCEASSCSGVTSASRLSPSGVSSYNQEKISVGTKPRASSPTSVFITHGGASNTGSRVPATCTITHAPTRYNPAMRITFRRFSSPNRSI